ncbi:ThuA domain-containing protein [Luteolibacter arcticus]|uniref:ThuA domain-containing protein n=1 Tax=Luteolibacter arcticus TaxID=1581411 RepID=A0ABT3GIU0_9BACT|nr:PVC-type heme-binding CxxCH protein [Luteolibacter arcticus]MCW1923420.1 ThuA domain-containing protein [Luteolibacter arcticus]
MHAIRLTLLLPLAALGAVLAKPLIAPKPEARRLEVLFFGAPTANGPGHDPVTRYRAIKRNLGTEGIDFTYSENPAEALSPSTLAKYDAVLMYGNWEQNGPMPTAQLSSLTAYVENGGAFLPIHCASACYGKSPEFIKLVGGRFKGHTAGVFKATNVNPEHPIMRSYGGFEAWDETYVHDTQSEDRVILEKRDQEPWTWVREQGKGRIFYTAAGHDHRVWDQPAFRDLIKRAILWSVGPEKQAKLAALELPVLEQQEVELPGYVKRELITKAQKPLSAEDSMKLAQVPAGFELSLFASEPDIVNPIFVNWDHRGRAFVIQTVDYPNNLHSGNLGNDKIIICDDTDKDGRADKFTTFADKLSIPTSLVFANGGMICTNGTDMLFLQDTDGDDKSDVRKVLFTGFSMGDTHAGVSNLRYGHDGWIYATVGYSGFRGYVGGKQQQFTQGIFRFKPDASELEYLQPTTNNTWGLGTTSDFDVMGSTANGNPSFYPTHAQAAYESIGRRAPRTPRADDNPIFNPSSTDIRQVDQHEKYTAGAGHAFYTAERFPAEWREKAAFVTEATGKLVGTFDITRQGSGYKAVQRFNNLYNSADAWSGPVCAEVGPDGAMWICDWYNLIIQHNPTPNKRSAGLDAKNGKGNAYETPLRDTQYGRIYRIYPKGSPDDATPGLDPAKPETLIAALDHPNLLWRLHAQRLIIESGNKQLAEKLGSLAAAGTRGSAHAVYALAGLGAMNEDTASTALKSKVRAIQRAGIKVATPQQLKEAYIAEGAFTVADDRELADALVSLSRLPEDVELGKALFNLITKEESRITEEVTLKDAWLIAAHRHAASVTAAAKAAGYTGEVIEKLEMPNQMPNPGFNEVVDGKPTGWNEVRVYGDGTPFDVSTTADGRNGTPGLALSSTAKAVDGGAVVNLRVKPATRYRLSVWAKAVGLQPVGDGLGAMLFCEGGERSGNVKGDSEWTQLSTELDTGDRSRLLVHCLIGAFGGATGTVIFDDISLTEIPGASGAKGLLAELAAKAANPAASATAKKFAPDPEVHKRGAEIYGLTCIACHQPTGAGLDGAFPPLDGSDWATGDPSVPIRIVTGGLQGPVKVAGKDYNAVMPAHVDLDDQKVSDVLTYVRQSWSNDASPVTPVQVKEIRERHKDRTTPWTAAELSR